MACISSNVSKAREATWSGPSSAHQSDTAGGTIAFEVEDLDRLMTNLEGKGVTFKSDITTVASAGWRCAWTARVTPLRRPSSRLYSNS